MLFYLLFSGSVSSGQARDELNRQRTPIEGFSTSDIRTQAKALRRRLLWDDVASLTCLVIASGLLFLAVLPAKAGSTAGVVAGVLAAGVIAVVWLVLYLGIFERLGYYKMLREVLQERQTRATS
jgi:hypothetical protein